MKQLLITYFWFFIPIITFTQTPEYRISNWLNNKKAALSITFDDALTGQWEYALPTMNARNIKGTFFVCTGSGSYPTNWTNAQSATNDGHEIASHSITHPNLRSLTEEGVDIEMRNSRDTINSRINGQICYTIAWPFGEGGGGSDSMIRRVASRYYHFARNTTSGATYYDPYLHYDNAWFKATGRNYWLQIGGYIMQTATGVVGFSTLLNSVINNGGWSVPLYHAIEYSGYESISAAIFTQQMDSIVHYENMLWVAPFRDVARYHKQKNVGQTTLTEVSSDETAWTLNLTDTLSNNSIYCQPLTIRLKKPAFPILSIKQNSQNINFIEDGDTIQFNTIPNGGDIILYKFAVSATAIKLLSNPVKIYPNPTHDFINIENAKGQISISDIRGNILIQKHNNDDKLNLNISNLPKGIYIIKVKNIENEFIKKLVVK
jgi:peptidoglycan/xylan/chitin deacetylase (PgdA/CDA1 family)